MLLVKRCVCLNKLKLDLEEKKKKQNLSADRSVGLRRQHVFSWMGHLERIQVTYFSNKDIEARDVY